MTNINSIISTDQRKTQSGFTASKQASAEILQGLFREPQSIHRGKAFWALNGRLETEELIRQIVVMKEMGLGGFFMHARVGLETPYLSGEWFEYVKKCVNQAQHLGLEAWLYDEDRWPSGFAGGMVTKEKKYRIKRLQMVVSDGRYERSDDVVAAFECEIDGSTAKNIRKIPKSEDISPSRENNSVVIFRIRTVRESENFNGQTYVDTLSEEAVGQFISLTHEAYKKEIGENFGSVCPGIFTDEPNHGPVCDSEVFMKDEDSKDEDLSEIPWTDELLNVFEQRYGYDLTDSLPRIFFDAEGETANRVRHHYNDCITHLFVNSFSSQIGKWCRDNGLLFTGHVLHEDPLSKNASFVGSSMRFYEHMDVPGVDVLTAVRPEYTTIKQCSSVARQLDKKGVLSELYGCTGWDFDFEGHKAIGDWQAILGVSVRCLHLMWYTMKGQAKRDYPASIFFQSPWWREYKNIEDYFARVNLLNDNSYALKNVLVIHPNESMWQYMKFGWTDGTEHQKPDSQHRELCRWLLEGHIDFDYGDEEMLSRMGKIINGDHPRFAVGQAEYRTVLVPDLLTIRKTTVRLLERFAEAGGDIVFTGSLPKYIEGEKAESQDEFDFRFTKIDCRKKDIINALEKNRDVRLLDSGGDEIPELLYRLSEDEKDDIYLFVVNTSRQTSFENITIHVKTGGRGLNVEQWNCENAEISKTEHRTEGEWIQFNCDLPVSGSRYFVLTEQKRTHLPAKPKETVLDTRKLNGAWEYELTEPNVMVLDRVSFKYQNEDYAQTMDVLKADDRIRKKMNLRPRGGRMLQPWYRKQNENFMEPPQISLRYSFKVNNPPNEKLNMAAEPLISGKYYLNGVELNKDEQARWVDNCFDLYNIDPQILNKGRNEIMISGAYDRDRGVEAVYLLGNFGVGLNSASPVMVNLPSIIKTENWCRQGLPFYSGAVRYKRRISAEGLKDNKLKIDIPAFGGSFAKVIVDGKCIKTLCTPPYETIINKHNYGQDVLELIIEVCSHRKNTFGPLHAVGQSNRPGWIGPDEFVTTGDRWTNDYVLTPCGLLEPPLLRIINSN